MRNRSWCRTLCFCPDQRVVRATSLLRPQHDRCVFDTVSQIRHLLTPRLAGFTAINLGCCFADRYGGTSDSRVITTELSHLHSLPGLIVLRLYASTQFTVLTAADPFW